MSDKPKLWRHYWKSWMTIWLVVTAPFHAVSLMGLIDVFRWFFVSTTFFNWVEGRAAIVAVAAAVSLISIGLIITHLDVYKDEDK